MLEALQWFALLAAVVLAYETLRYLLFRRLRTAFRRSVQEFLNRHQVQIAKFQFANKLLVRQTLLNDPEIHQAVMAHAAETGCPLEEARDKVETYIEEIVPSFNLVSYYKIGYPLARLFIHSLFSPVVDRSGMGSGSEIPANAATIYVMNHRSNVDFILAGYVLSEQVALSYAVGEWARVWPLEELFKSFGSYFVRRNFREPLYHLVLEKYVQLLTRKAGKQAIFIEGGLSRDGRFREPKIGLLDYIVKVKRDPAFARDLVFVPAGINFDRVLEDEFLLGEKSGQQERRGFRERMISLFRVLRHLARSLGGNLYRYATGAVLRHGYAAVCFGAPVSFDSWMAERGIRIADLTDDERRARVKEFADLLMRRIGEVLPVTPVALTATVLTGIPHDRISRTELARRVRTLRETLVAAGAHVVEGKEFDRTMRGRATHAEERALYHDDLFDVVDQMFASDVAQQTLDIALDVLEERGLVREENGIVTVAPGAGAVLQYYANSIVHLTTRTPAPGGTP